MDGCGLGLELVVLMVTMTIEVREVLGNNPLREKE